MVPVYVTNIRFSSAATCVTQSIINERSWLTVKPFPSSERKNLKPNKNRFQVQVVGRFVKEEESERRRSSFDKEIRICQPPELFSGQNRWKQDLQESDELYFQLATTKTLKALHA